MINRSLHKDFFIHGILASLLWHFSWVLILFPIVRYPQYRAPVTRAIFLGSILNRDDFDVSGSKEIEQKITSKTPVDLSRSDYFIKTLAMPQKPKASLVYQAKRVFPDRLFREFDRQPVDTSAVVVFGLHDFARYLDNVDFAELKRVSTREDLREGIDLELTLGDGGVIDNVEKISGSGDPVLDLYILRKFKTAIFKEFWPVDKPVRVRFNIRG